jgi:hypothetical protein
MKAVVIAGIAVVLVAAALWFTRDSGTEPFPKFVNANAPVTDVSEAPDDTSVTGETPKLAHVDPGRLREKSYETDPDIQVIARELGVMPACVIALAQYQILHMAMEDGVCPQPPQAEPARMLAVAMDHPYVKYSDAELESLAISDPIAAVVLARRTESDAKARKLYERAVALSGLTDPLLEWMSLRDSAGLFRKNGVLDVEAAKKGYAIFLTVAALEGHEDPIIETYQRELRNQGVDLGIIERQAAQHVADLRRERKELTGGERP